jgi:hypothetical protein
MDKTGSSFKALINLCAAVSQQFLESRIDIEHDLSAAMRAAGQASRGRCARPLPVQQSITSAATANRSLLVPVTSECGARRGHRGRICDLSERRDGDQQDQRENSDECPHGTSPHDIPPYCGILSRRQVKVACDDPILGYCFPLRRCPPPIESQTAALFLLAAPRRYSCWPRWAMHAR